MALAQAMNPASWWRRMPLLVALSSGLLLATTVRTQFRTQTTLVLVDVVVRDASGATVDDLDRSEFTVFEDGAPRAIVAFDRGFGGKDLGNATVTQPYRWNDSRRTQPQSMTAVIFHYLDPQSRTAAVGGARRMIASLGASEFIGIYALEEALVELAPFTSDVGVLTAALDAVARTPSTNTGVGSGVAEAGGSLDSSAPGGAEAAAMRGRMGSGFAGIERRQAAGVQTEALSRLIADLSQFPGRRAVLLYSQGLATPDVLPGLEGVVAAASRQHVSFYCIKASGLGTGRRHVQARRRYGRSELTSSNAEELERRVNILEMDPTNGLGPLADLTGGMHLSGTNDITAATARANDDRRHYYLLGYSSGEGVDPDRAIVTVRLSRPGLNVRARTRVGRR
jgi:VWFA-related protein